MAAPVLIAATVAAVAVHPATAPDFWALTAKVTGIALQIVQQSMDVGTQAVMLPANVMFAPGYDHPRRKRRHY